MEKTPQNLRTTQKGDHKEVLNEKKGPAFAKTALPVGGGGVLTSSFIRRTIKEQQSPA